MMRIFNVQRFAQCIDNLRKCHYSSFCNKLNCAKTDTDDLSHRTPIQIKSQLSHLNDVHPSTNIGTVNYYTSWTIDVRNLATTEWQQKNSCYVPKSNGKDEG